MISSSTAVAATTSPKSLQKSPEDANARHFQSFASRSVGLREVELKPIKSAISYEKWESSVPVPRGKTMVEVLSRIGDQTSNPDAAAVTSPKPGETGNHGQDACPVSIFVNVSDDGWQTVIHSGMKDAAMESGMPSVTQSLKAGSGFELVEQERSRSRSPVTRLDVTKTLGEGLSLRRSHSCSEIRRRTVLAEWEVVTTTSMEVIVTETGATSQHTDQGTSSSEKQTKQDASKQSRVGSETQIVDHSTSCHDSGSKNLGLAVNVVGHRRSKSSDVGTRRLIAAASTDEIRAISSSNEVEHAAVDVRPVSLPDEELRRRQRIAEVDTQPIQSEAGNLLSEDHPVMNQLLVETGSEPVVTAVATYTLSEPSAVDRFSSIEDTGWEDRWAMGLTAGPIDYSVVDFIENIRLAADGTDVNPEEPEYVEKWVDISGKNSANGCPEVSFQEGNSVENEGGLCEEVFIQSSSVPHQLQCQSAACESEVTDQQDKDQQQKSCLNRTNDDSFDDSGRTVDKSQEMMQVVPLSESTGAAPPTHDDSVLDVGPTDITVTTAQSRVKEDEDNEEKEADEAENRETESDQTEEKGTLELNQTTVEKTGHETTDAAADSVEPADISGNMAEVQEELTAIISDDSQRQSEQPAINEERGQVELEDQRSVTDVVAAGTDAVSGSSTSVMNSSELPGDVTAVTENQCDSTRYSEDCRAETRSYPDEIIHRHDGQSDVSDLGPSPAVDCQSRDADSCCLESTGTRSNIVVPELHCSETVTSDTAIEDERNAGCRLTTDETRTQCDGKGPGGEQVMPAAAKSSETMEDSKLEDEASNMEEVDRDNTELTWSQTGLTNTDLVPPASCDDHTLLPTGHAIQTVNAVDDASNNKSLCVSTGTDTSYDENPGTADNPMRSTTFDDKDTLQNPEQASEAIASASEDAEGGKCDATGKPRRRKNVVDVESQTEDFSDGNKPENSRLISESTQCTVDSSQTVSQHPFSSCTAVNCLVCATIGKYNVN